MRVRLLYAIAVMAMWVGFVLAISFMEAWLKFTAPGITLPLGLGIGRIVFAALNKVELCCAATVLVLLFNQVRQLGSTRFLLLATPLAILAIETLYMLPALDMRATIYLAGKVPPPSQLHILYVFCDFIKVVSLIFNIVITMRLLRVEAATAPIGSNLSQ